jgi:hypothetical protein
MFRDGGMENLLITCVAIAPSSIQAESKFSRIQPNRAKPAQKQSKKTAWFSLDVLVRIEPFQGVALTPRGKKSCLAPFPLN